jgi:hypothetical protein
VAINVPIEEQERAAVYEAVLAEILLSNRSSSDFQEAADQMSTSGMTILLNAPSDRKFLPGADDRSNFETLRQLGLARKFDLARFLLLLLAWCIGTGMGSFVLTRIMPRFLPTTMSIGFVWEGALFSGLFFAAGMALLYANYTLTELGRKLQSSALRFYPTRKGLREFRIGSLVPSGFLAWAAVSVVLAWGTPLLLNHYLPSSETLRTIVLSAPPQAPPAAAPATPSPNAPKQDAATQSLQTQDVAALIDFWHSVSEQMTSTVENVDQIEALLSDWPKKVSETKSDLYTQLNEL